MATKMDTASESDGEEEVLELDARPYSRRPEWSDVDPLEYDDTGEVVAIQYSEEHAELLAYFRAVMARGEKSERALSLTADLIRSNQADYTAWQYRWLCLLALRTDLKSEYAFTEEILKDNAKNYQLWNHRRKCAVALGPAAAARELSQAAAAIELDEKNYHAWAHRQAIVAAFGGELWAAERAYALSMLERDVRNNSAWNQLAFVLQHTLQQQGAAAADAGAAPAAAADGPSGTSGGAAQQQQLQQALWSELEFVAEKVQAAPRNESAWNYLCGLFSLPECPPHEMARHPEVYTLCREALMDVPSCPPAMDVLAQYYLHTACLAAHAYAAAINPPPAGSNTTAIAAKQAVKAATGHASSLLTMLSIADPIRTMYWQHRQRELEELRAAVGLLPA